MEPTAGVDPAPAPYEGAVLPITLRRLVQAQRFELRSHAYRARVLPLDEAWVVGREGIEPSVAGLKDRSFTVVASVPSYALVTSEKLDCSRVEIALGFTPLDQGEDLVTQRRQFGRYFFA